MAKRMCTIDGCDAPHVARGWCSHHYNEWHYYRRQPTSATNVPPDCRTCHGPLPPKKPTGPPPTYCSVKCRRDAQKPAQAAGAKSRAERRKAKRPDRACFDCGATIPGVAPLSRIYCSKTCSARASRKRQTRLCEVLGCERKHVAKGMCQIHYSAASPNAKKWKRGNPETRRANLRRKTQQRRARLRDPEAELIDRDEIGDRDHWQCGLCGKKVDRALQWPDRRSASLDHIIPLATGGVHAKANVQISHFDCNMAKGARGGGEQLLLIG